MAIPEKTSRPARRGYLVLLAVFAAAVLIFNIERILAATRPTIKVVALVEHAPDVRVGTDVWVEGVRMGRVTEVTLVKEGDSALVGMGLRLDRQARALVTPSSDVRVSRRRFIAEPVVRVFAGSPGDRLLEQNDTLRGRPRPGPDELLAKVAALAPALDSVLTEAATIQARFETRRPAIERFMAQMETATAQVSSLTTEAGQGSLGRMMDGTTGLPAQVGALRQRFADLQGATEQLAERYSAEGPLGSEMERLGDRLNSLDAALAGLQLRVDEGDGFLGRMQADSALEVAVRGVQLQIDSLMAEAHSIALRMLLP